LTGYSGGAAATGWAAQLWRSYAPELTVVGAAVGGVPADPVALSATLDGGPFAGFEYAAAVGLRAEYPEAGVDRLLNPAGRADLAAATGRCTQELLLRFAFHRLADDTVVERPLADPAVVALLRRNALGAIGPRVPVLDFHAVTDEVVPVGQDDALVRAWCERGAAVAVVRDPVGEHVLEGRLRRARAADFLAARFAGQRPQSSCADPVTGRR
jgi:hypothetical protein